MTREEEKVLKAEAKKAIEAAKTLADYCNNTPCDICPFTYVDKAIGSRSCRLAVADEGSNPFTWWYMLEEIEKEWKEFMEEGEES